MEFGKKLYELRKRKGLTQEELAQMLYVSRTAVSKWESGKGYPNIDSLKGIAKLFSVSVDELLSGDELLTVAEEDTKQSKKKFCDLVFGLLDLCAVLFFFLPFFGQSADGAVQEVSLLNLTLAAPYMKVAYCVSLVCVILWGVLLLALQNCNLKIWVRIKSAGSVILNVLGILLFVVGRQTYGAISLSVFLGIKVLIIIKRR